MTEKELCAELNRVTEENHVLRAIVIAVLWMARRYCDMRSTYAPGMFNEATRMALHYIPREQLAKNRGEGALFARDGMGRVYDKLSPEEVAACEEDQPARWMGDNEREAFERGWEAAIESLRKQGVL